MESKLVSACIALALCFSSSCTANNSTPVISDHTTIGNYSLILDSTKPLCSLQHETKGSKLVIELTLKSPCYFMRRGSTAPQSFAYDDVGVSATIMVVGTLISDDKRKKWNIDIDSICGESRQAILIKDSGLVVSDKTLEGGVACKDKGADEKDFWYFAH